MTMRKAARRWLFNSNRMILIQAALHSQFQCSQPNTHAETGIPFCSKVNIIFGSCSVL